jgi:precorrin-4/cobalt-precorrin-4 C11-methyltransferase
MPPGEDLATLGATGATLAIHLSARNIDGVVQALLPSRGADCPVAVVFRASWPDQNILRGTLADIAAQVKAAGITRTAIILVGRVLGDSSFPDSMLYDPGFAHLTRPHRED